MSALKRRAGSALDDYLDALRRYGVFSGRSTRRQFWHFILVQVILLALAQLADMAIFDQHKPEGPIFKGTFLLHLLPTAAASVRRLHDGNWRGWWYLVSIVPILGTAAYILMMCLPSTPGRNRFGHSPGAMKGKDVAAPLQAGQTSGTES